MKPDFPEALFLIVILVRDLSSLSRKKWRRRWKHLKRLFF